MTHAKETPTFTIDRETREILGCTVECLDLGSDGSLQVPYELTGPRGASYGLVRYMDKPELMHVIRPGSMRRDVAIKGVRHFTDATGKLEAVR